MSAGHFDLIQARTTSLVENARRQGMSESALARLPKVSAIKPAKPLPKVVLAAASESFPERQANMKAYRQRAATSAAPRVRKRRASRTIGAHVGRKESTSDDYTLFRRIVDLAETSSGVSSAEVRDFIRSRRVIPVRHICWRLFREFSGLGTTGIALIAGRACHTSILQGIAAALRYDAPDRVALYWEIRTLLSTAGHRIVEDLEKKGGRT